MPLRRASATDGERRCDRPQRVPLSSAAPRTQGADLTTQDKLFALFIIFGGAFTLRGALTDWPYFWNHPKTKNFVEWMGVGGTRAFYGVLGSFLLAMGMAALLGMISLARR